MDQRERVAEFNRELEEGPEPSDRSIKEIVEALRPQLQELARKQVELARTELGPVGRRAGVATALLTFGALLLILFLVFISLTAIYALVAAGLSQWLSALIVSGALLLIGVILAGSGAGILRSLDPKPHRTIRALQQNVNWIKGQFRS